MHLQQQRYMHIAAARTQWTDCLNQDPWLSQADTPHSSVDYESWPRVCLQPWMRLFFPLGSVASFIKQGS